MFQKQKLAFRRYCKEHKALYSIFSPWFGRKAIQAMRSARREKGLDGNLVVFASYMMEAYNDNPFYICRALHEMRPQTELVWVFKDIEKARARFDIPDWVRCVRWETPECYEALGRAKVLVDNWRKPDYLRFDKDQIYLFSPHHDRSFKHGVFTMRGRFYTRVLESHASAATTGSDFCKEMLRVGYHFNGPYIDEGLPRNDILVREDPADDARVRAKLGIDADTKLLLYAPTFRDIDTNNERMQSVMLDLDHILDVLEETTGQRWLCLHRAHYLSLGLDMKAASSRLIDATAYPEMADLLRVADALISDYSCCAGDYLLRHKPIWLYLADIDSYTAQSRDLYVNPLDTPYWCAKTPDELDALIRKTTPERARENCQAVLDFYGAHETGHASEAAARYICGHLSP